MWKYVINPNLFDENSVVYISVSISVDGFLTVMWVGKLKSFLFRHVVVLSGLRPSVHVVQRLEGAILWIRPEFLTKKLDSSTAGMYKLYFEFQNVN